MTRRTAPIPFEPMTVLIERAEARRDGAKELRRCAKCLMPETEQTITFDEQGICNLCQISEDRDEDIDWKARRLELDEILSRHRGKYLYDAIVPFSGGKDSAWTAYVCVRRLNLKVLLVTFDSNFRRPIHLQNIENVVRRLGCDHMTYRAGQDAIKKTMKESLKRRGDFCWFCHTGVVATPFKAALQYQVPLIIWGEPGSEYSGGYYNYKTKTPPDERWYNRQINLGINAEDMAGFVDVEMRDLEPFRLPPWEKMKELGVESIHLGDYLKWNAGKQVDIIKEELGWREAEVENLHPKYHYEKVECFLQGARDYLRYIKRGYSRTVQRANLDVRRGELTRDEAEKMIHYDAQRPASLDVLLPYLGVSEDEFMQIARSHQIYPHVHDPATVRHAQKKVDDQPSWEKRLLWDIDPDAGLAGTKFGGK
jgi:N-acetyl sugar amidotransferase